MAQAGLAELITRNLYEQAVDGPQHAFRVPVPELVEGMLDLRDAGVGCRMGEIAGV